MTRLSSSAGLLTDLLARRERSLLWLTLLCAALLFCLSAGLSAGLPLAGAWAWTPLLGGGLWALVALWVVARTRAEGEPPDAGPTLLLLVVFAQLVALFLAGSAVVAGARGGWGWLLLAAVVLPWRALVSLPEADPVHRIERLWRLHGVSGRLLVLGALAPLLVLGREPPPGIDSLSAVATLAMTALCGVALSVVAVRTRSVAAELDQVRLVVPDLPPQPSLHRFPAGMAGIAALSLLGSGLWSAPWPTPAVLQARLVDAGWLAPADGRLRWMVLEDRQRRVLTRTGPVMAQFSPGSPILVATAGGSNPAFWVLWEGLGWYPQQLRDVWDVTELALSPGGDALWVGRRHGLLQRRSLPTGQSGSAWVHNEWDPLETRAPGGRLHYMGDVPVALSGEHTLLRWQAAAETWVPWLTVPDAPIQGFAPSPDGQRLALVVGSREVVILDAASGAQRQVIPASGVRRVLWTPDSGSLLVAGMGVERVRLADGQRTRLEDAPVIDIALDGTGRLAIASYGVTVVDAETGAQLLAEVLPAGGAARSVSWHPTDGVLAIGTFSGEVELWTLSEHRQETTIAAAR